MEQHIINNYSGVIQTIKNAILRSRYRAVKIKRMRQFYEGWQSCFETLEGSVGAFRLLVADEIGTTAMEDFFGVGFIHRYELLIKSKSLEERLFYLQWCASEFWNKDKLRYNLKSDLYAKRGTLPNNFNTTIPDVELRRKALLSFKDEYSFRDMYKPMGVATFKAELPEEYKNILLNAEAIIIILCDK